MHHAKNFNDHVGYTKINILRLDKLELRIQ